MIIKLVVGLVVLAQMVSANCRIGPTYWCANIPQAAQCNALPFCIQAVWTKEKVEKDTDEVCDICKDMVGQARDTLLSNETQDELRQVFEGSCDLIPIKIVRKECKALADQFVPELVETLSSEMNPDTVCTVAGLCNSARIDLMLENMYSKNGQHCNTCMTQMSTAQDTLTALSDVQFEDMLQELCGHFDSYSDACMYTVSTQLATIRSMLQTWVSPSACTTSVCLSRDILSVSQYSEDIECEFCTKVVKHWIDVYASDSSLEQFKEILDGLCDKIHKNSAHCKRIVDDYYIPLFEYLRKVDPHMICSAVGICHANANVSHPLTSLFSTKQYLPLTPLLTAKTEAKPTCLLCEYVMHNLESYLKDAHNEEQIKEYLDGLCMDVPTNYQDVCKSFIDKYEAQILQMFASEIHPAQMCKEINLCSTAPVPKRPSSSCQTCHIVAEEVFSVFSDKDDVNMVKNVLESICYRFPEYIDEPCETFVDKYVTAFITFVAEGLTPDELCDALDMCNSNDSHNFIETSSDDSTCVICEYAVSYLDKILEDKSSEEEIKEALESVCDLLPSSVKGQCDNFVDTYTDMIIQLLTGEITPKELCGYLGLCQDSQFYNRYPTSRHCEKWWKTGIEE